jgi:hypothetical protein
LAAIKIENGGLTLTSENAPPAKNMLGVGLDVPNQILIVNSSLAVANLKSAGIYFGMTQRNVLLFGVSKTASNAFRVFYQVFKEGNLTAEESKEIANPGEEIYLSYEANPGKTSLKLFYSAPQLQQLQQLKEVVLEDHWFGADAAGMDFFVATRTFGGIFGEGTFKSFGIYKPQRRGNTTVSNATYEFTRWSFPSEFPTGLAVAPDGFLYVASAAGHIMGYK